MTVCHLSTPRPGLGDTAAHKIRPKALKTLKTNSGTARVVQLEGKWLAAKRPSGGTKSKVRRSQPAGRAAADKIRRKALKRLKTDSAKVRVVQLRGKGQPAKRPSGGTKGKVRRSQPAGGAARLGVTRSARLRATTLILREDSWTANATDSVAGRRPGVGRRPALARHSASSPTSPVRIRMTRSIGVTKILPSPI